jgi:hypothetical protein
VDKVFLSCYEITRHGLIESDATPITIYKSEVKNNLSISLDDIQIMINYVLEKQGKSSNEMIHRLIEERWKKIIDPNVNASSSSGSVNFVETNN